MANENTHLYLASIIRKRLPKRQRDIIDKNPNLYYLGAMAPDILLYSRKFRPLEKRLQSRAVIKDLAKNCRKEDLPFLYGYITHIETDEVFHKAIPKDTYEHLYAETSVDKHLGLKKPMSEYFHPEIPQPFVKTAKIPGKTFLRILKRQMWLNKIFLRSGFWYHFAPRVVKPMFHKYVKILKLPKDVDKLLKKSVENSVREIKKCAQN